MKFSNDTRNKESAKTRREERWKGRSGDRDEEETCWGKGAAGRSCRRYSRVVEHTPAAVGVTRAKALTAAPILTTGLHGHSGELGQDNKRDSGQGFAGHSVVPQKEAAVYQVYHLKQVQEHEGSRAPEPKGTLRDHI